MRKLVDRSLDRLVVAVLSLPGIAGVGCVVAAADLQAGHPAALLTAGAFLLLIDDRRL